MNDKMLERNAVHDLIMQTALRDCVCHLYKSGGICTRCAALELANEAFPVHFFRVMSGLPAPDGLVKGEVPYGVQP